MQEQDTTSTNKPLLIYLDDDGAEKAVHSYYILKDGTISFETKFNKITLPVSRLIKIKEVKQ